MNLVKDFVADHGAESKDKEKGEQFLSGQPLLTLLLLVLIVVLGQFWYQALFQLVKNLTGQKEPSIWLLISSAIIVTVAFFLLARYLIKVPIINLV
jgi:uncharacterized membrane protein YidH (DUF202 family)